MDTYGYVLFVKGKFQDSEIWIKRSLDKGASNSGTVLEHYGDVLFKLNRTAEALEYWNKAKEAGDASDRIDQKIEQKKYIE